MRSSLRSLALLLALAALLAPAAAAAQAQNDRLQVARYNFEYGDYQKAIQLIEQLQQEKVLSDGPDLIEAWRILGLSHFYLGHSEDARASFVRLLMIEPDYTLDPVLVPPVAVLLLEQIKKDNEAMLSPIREIRRKAAEQRRAEEEARRRLLEREERRRRERDSGPAVMQRVERHAFLTNFLPFGAAQLEQGRGRVGAIIAVAQGLTLASSVLSYSQVQEYVGSDGKVDRADIDSARTWRTVNWISFGAAASVYLAGVLDAVLHFQEETVSFVAVPRESLKAVPTTPPSAPATDPEKPSPAAPPPSDAPTAPSAPEPKPDSPALSAQFFLSPLPGGAAAGIVGTF